MSKEFIEHLERASKIVQKWPLWKQEILGGMASVQRDKKDGNDESCKQEKTYR